MSATVCARVSGSVGSGGLGRPWATSQKLQRRVQTSPRIMNVAVPWLKHSWMFGQLASSHTVTSVDRDDLRDGGAQHFVDCIAAIREHSPRTRVEILTPDFRGKGRMDRALEIFATQPPDVFNHNVETVPDLYRNVRPGADYQWSMTLLQRFKAEHPEVVTKSGVMLGLGETMPQVEQTLRDLRAHDVDMITIGQYLQPSAHHHPVMRYWTPEEFKQLEDFGHALGFTHVASGPLVRSSYHADRSAAEAGLAVGA